MGTDTIYGYVLLVFRWYLGGVATSVQDLFITCWRYGKWKWKW